jgi:hypothetical protein
MVDDKERQSQQFKKRASVLLTSTIIEKLKENVNEETLPLVERIKDIIQEHKFA